MFKRTDTAPRSDTVGVPEPRLPEDDHPNTCAVCGGSCAVKETVLFWRIGEDAFGVAHPDCALPPAVRS